jgi:hypothetical protein
MLKMCGLEDGDFFPVGGRNGSLLWIVTKKQATALWLGEVVVEKQISPLRSSR